MVWVKNFDDKAALAFNKASQHRNKDGFFR
jgi:hypothetical protein